MKAQRNKTRETERHNHNHKYIKSKQNERVGRKRNRRVNDMEEVTLLEILTVVLIKRKG